MRFLTRIAMLAMLVACGLAQIAAPAVAQDLSPEIASLGAELARDVPGATPDCARSARTFWGQFFQELGPEYGKWLGAKGAGLLVGGLIGNLPGALIGAQVAPVVLSVGELIASDNKSVQALINAGQSWRVVQEDTSYLNSEYLDTPLTSDPHAAYANYYHPVLGYDAGGLGTVVGRLQDAYDAGQFPDAETLVQETLLWGHHTGHSVADFQGGFGAPGVATHADFHSELDEFHTDFHNAGGGEAGLNTLLSELHCDFHQRFSASGACPVSWTSPSWIRSSVWMTETPS